MGNGAFPFHHRSRKENEMSEQVEKVKLVGGPFCGEIVEVIDGMRNKLIIDTRDGGGPNYPVYNYIRNPAKPGLFYYDSKVRIDYGLYQR